MTEPVQVLLLEDNRFDAQLVEHLLEADGLACRLTCVETKADFEAALAKGGFSAIVSDMALPDFNGLSALALAQAIRPETPFLFFSGTLGEDQAIEALKAGATDYVLKSRPNRLPVAIRQALRHAEERAKRGQAEHSLNRAEAQLRQAQKMDALGRLAGGIAHDFNNLLTVITGTSYFLLRHCHGEPLLREKVQRIKEAGERGAALTRQLLAFSRQQALAPTVLDVNGVVAGMDGLLRRLIGEDVTLTLALSAAPLSVLADASQLEQVVMNLVTNARDALDGGGTITISTRLGSPAQGHPANDRPAGPFVALDVADNGCGMDRDTLVRIFEPFFTTKDEGKGTGLGLATVYGIVAQSGGQIEVASEPGQGTTFSVYLPQVEGVPVAATPAPSASAVTGSETILLVEDEPDVLVLACEVLAGAGFQVLQAGQGAEALALAERHRGPIHLLLTDVVMPEMGGPDLAERLRAVRPDMACLFMSGYTSARRGRRKPVPPGAAFLAKPFLPDDLLVIVREVLDRTPRQTAKPAANRPSTRRR